MQIHGVAMVRNEADLIEAFVRHNAGVVDALHVVDHRSEDGTREILEDLMMQGLPLTLERYDGAAQRQPEIVTRLARGAFAAGADCVVPLDADEFLKIPRRSEFERAIRSFGNEYCAVMQWQTYVPDAMPAYAHPLAAARKRRATEAHGLRKVVLTRAFARTPQAVVGAGNHTVLMEGPGQDLATNPARLALLPAHLGALAHFPVRSATQLVRKINVGWQAHVAAGRDDAALAYHWRELYEDFAQRGAPDDARLREIAVNYGVPMAHWEAVESVELVEDPLPSA
jgi:hypothetical protein